MAPGPPSRPVEGEEARHWPVAGRRCCETGIWYPWRSRSARECVAASVGCMEVQGRVDQTAGLGSEPAVSRAPTAAESLSSTRSQWPSRRARIWSLLSAILLYEPLWCIIIFVAGRRNRVMGTPSTTMIDTRVRTHRLAGVCQGGRSCRRQLLSSRIMMTTCSGWPAQFSDWHYADGIGQWSPCAFPIPQREITSANAVAFWALFHGLWTSRITWMASLSHGITAI